MSEYSLFKEKAATRAQDEVHRKKLLKVIATYDSAVGTRKASQFLDWEVSRHIAGSIKEHTLDTLPELLEEFERHATARGVKVLWARDVAEAQRHLLDIVQRHHATQVVKSKSMTTEEIHVNELLEAQGVRVWESDLGELIVQLAGEKPYHIVTPCMHKSKAEVSELFHQKLGTPLTENAEDLAMAARQHLREAYLSSEIGISGANFLIADIGAVHLLENEGNGRLSVSCPPVHVVLSGIEKVLPRLADLELFLPLLATSGTGQQLTVYNSLIRGPRQNGEQDGPKEMYVILLDNGRTKLYADPEFRKALRCIRCGACLNACPVYKSVGGHSYHTAYPGPIGAVITPHLRGLKEWNHLAYASSLCGACTEVCPVNIPLHHLLLKNRALAEKNGYADRSWGALIKIWSIVYRSRAVVDFMRQPAAWCRKLIKRLMPGTPEVASRSFAQRWRNRER